jgi:hypothetical protein
VGEIFRDGQEIVYRKNGEEIARVSRRSGAGGSLADHLRYFQHNTKVGDQLCILRENQAPLRTSSVVAVDLKDNTLIFKTKNSTYEVEYININLEELLKQSPASEGPFP